MPPFCPLSRPLLSPLLAQAQDAAVGDAWAHAHLSEFDGFAPTSRKRQRATLLFFT